MLSSITPRELRDQRQYLINLIHVIATWNPDKPNAMFVNRKRLFFSANQTMPLNLEAQFFNQISGLN
ncbi:MAG: hypothetical protein ACXWAT_16275 [Methylobacter sp.]